MGLAESKSLEELQCCSFDSSKEAKISRTQTSLPSKAAKDTADNGLGVIKMGVWTSSNVLSIKLCEYAATDHADGINHLCEKQGAVIYLNFLNAEGYAPLHLACMKGASQAAFALVGHGSDVGMKSREGFSAVQYAQKVGAYSLVNYLESVGKPNGMRAAVSPSAPAGSGPGRSSSGATSTSPRSSWSPVIATPGRRRGTAPAGGAAGVFSYGNESSDTGDVGQRDSGGLGVQPGAPNGQSANGQKRQRTFVM